jgi:hypothetical protein
MARRSGVCVLLVLALQLGLTAAAAAPARSYIDCINDESRGAPPQTTYRDFVDGNPTR